MTTIITFSQITLCRIYSSVLFGLHIVNPDRKLNTFLPKRRRRRRDNFAINDSVRLPASLLSVVSRSSLLRVTYSLLLEPFSCGYMVGFHVRALKYTPGLALAQVEILAGSRQWIQNTWCTASLGFRGDGDSK